LKVKIPVLMLNWRPISRQTGYTGLDPVVDYYYELIYMIIFIIVGSITGRIIFVIRRK